MTPPAGLRHLLDAANAQDTESFLGAFADDAVVDDGGRLYSGLLQIAEWNMHEVIGVQAGFAVLTATGTAEGVEVLTEVSGGGYRGRCVLTAELRGDLVARLALRPSPPGAGDAGAAAPGA